jgi:UDP-N-acetylmuramyl pentapeptide phosphotransferase/UDP-N-acetylglucosamine-1-phosphate transferase
LASALEWIVAVSVAAAVSAAVCGLMLRVRVLDAPGGLVRKGDRPATPTSGGLGVAAGFCAGAAWLASPFAWNWTLNANTDAVSDMAVALWVAFGALAVGLADDVAQLGPRIKAGIFAALAFTPALFIGHVEALPIGLGFALPLGPVLGVLGCALWMFTIINTVNFIDGANGLAMGSVAIGLLGLGAASFAVGAPTATAVALCGAGALIGFLPWNFPSGKLFAGDAGALFIGAIAGSAGLMAITEGGLSPFIPPIIFFPMLADVLLTLAWRVRHRTNVLDGHRDHFYQIALRSGAPHWKVSLVHWALMAKCAILGVALAMAPQVPPPQVVAQVMHDASPILRGFVLAAAGLASLATFLAFVVLAAVWLKASTGIRAYAKTRGFDAV